MGIFIPLEDGILFGGGEAIAGRIALPSHIPFLLLFPNPP